MCGIAGRYGVRPLESGEAGHLANAFQEALSRRGPDGWRYHHDENVVLVHRRLAIIDLSAAGAQPMWNEDHTICVIVNGEIYNYRELRQWLRGHGHRFRSDSDSEVLVHLYEQGGIDECCNRIQGMFAFALWDARARELYLVRDRLGIKPLVLAEHAGGVSFASTLPALLRDTQVPRELRDEALIAVLKWGFVPTPWSAVRAARRIEPGTWVQIQRGQVVACRRWWTDKPPLRSTNVPEVRLAVERAVRSHLVADVPIGVLLSSGIDSGIVTALASRGANDPPLEAWTVRHEGFVDDEYPGASLTAAHLGVPCHAIDLAADALTETKFREVVHGMDEPLAVSSLVGLHALFGAIAPNRRVILTGDGGDELFAGYDWHVGMPIVPSWANQRVFKLGARGLSKLDGAPGRLGVLAKVASHVRRHPASIYLDKLRITTDETLRKLGLDRIDDDPMEERARVAWECFDGSGALEQMLAVDRATTLVDEMLAKLDCASMTYGVEARVPLLADGVVAVATGVGAEHKRRDGTGKVMLRNWFDEVGPSGLSARRKTGFNSPLDEWFRSDRSGFVTDTTMTGLLKLRARSPVEALHFRTRFALGVIGAWSDALAL